MIDVKAVKKEVLNAGFTLSGDSPASEREIQEEDAFDRAIRQYFNGSSADQRDTALKSLAIMATFPVNLEVEEAVKLVLPILQKYEAKPATP